MALLTTGNFYTVTFLPTTNGAWAALGPNFPSGVSGALAGAIYLATPAPITIYVVDASTGLFSYVGGQAFGFDDTLVDSSTLLTSYTLTATEGGSTSWADDGAGTLIQFDSIAGTLKTFAGAMLGGFQAFIAAI